MGGFLSLEGWGQPSLPFTGWRKGINLLDMAMVGEGIGNLSNGGVPVSGEILVLFGCVSKL